MSQNIKNIPHFDNYEVIDKLSEVLSWFGGNSTNWLFFQIFLW